MGLWKAQKNQVKYKNNIGTHNWNFNKKIYEQDKFNIGWFHMFFACDKCGVKCIKKNNENGDVFIVIKSQQDAKLTCDQILMRDVLE